MSVASSAHGRRLPRFATLIALLLAFTGAVVVLPPQRQAVGLENGVARTPPMGWNTWNTFGTAGRMRPFGSVRCRLHDSRRLHTATMVRPMGAWTAGTGGRLPIIPGTRGLILLVGTPRGGMFCSSVAASR